VHRIIVHRADDELVLCLADHHDRAYAWAAQRSGAGGGGGEDPQVELAIEPGSTPGTERGPRPAPEPRGVDRTPVSPPSPPREARHASPRRLRVLRRAAGPLPQGTGTPLAGGAPSPLLHLLQFFHEAEAARRSEARAPALLELVPAGRVAQGAPSRRRRFQAMALMALAAALPWAGFLLAGLPRSMAVAGLLGLAALEAALVGRLAAALRRATARAGEAARREEERLAAERDLGAALESLRRDGTVVPPPSELAGPLGPAWAAVAALGRFLTLEAHQIRALVDARVAEEPRSPGGAG
jgi:hypothetical protein